MKDVLNLTETAAYNRDIFFEPDGYHELDWRTETARHIGEHVAKAAGKLVLVEVGQKAPALIHEEVAPDLALYRNQPASRNRARSWKNCQYYRTSGAW